MPAERVFARRVVRRRHPQRSQAPSTVRGGEGAAEAGERDPRTERAKTRA